MDEFFKLLTSGTPVATLIAVAILLLAILVSGICFVAFFQGRSLSFWLLKIGERPDIGSSRPVESSLAGGAMLTPREEPRPSPQKLAEFLGMPPTGGRARIFVPTTECFHKPDLGKPYKVLTVSVAHMQAVAEIVTWLGEITTFEPQDLFVDKNQMDEFSGPILFLIGGPVANEFVRRLVPVRESNSGTRNAPATPEHIGDKKIYVDDSGDEFRLICRGVEPDSFFIRPARGDVSIRDVEGEITYGCIMKVSEKECTTFAVWGLDERGTRGAARWLVRQKNWEQMQEERASIAILRFQPHRTYTADGVELHRSESGILVPMHTSYS